MRLRKKLAVQAITCVMIFTAIKASGTLDSDIIKKARMTAGKYFTENYTIADILDTGNVILDKIKDAPASLTSAVVSVNEMRNFSSPIDEKADNDIQSVHAAAGGIVAYAGIDKNLGMCIKIKHQSKVSVYGNLCTITAVTGDRVGKGDVIGTFNNSGEKEFYYQLEDSVV